ncbi:MAG TPA: RagB/SusD family nutrient uptake outer membrane protein [Chitinophagaceae bacterium]|nr:RagB/SusD family nutrient uptake outer membrane protein [Chitinophagaceae bacterium]
MKLKTIILLLVMGSLVTVQSCTKKLDLEPFQSIDAETAITTAEDVEAALIGAYSVLAGGALYGTNLLLLPDLQAAEGYLSWRGTFQGQRQISLKNMTRDNGEAMRTWVAGYRAINMANIVLDNTGVVKDADLKDQYEGEAMFIRGIMHFELVRYYGKPWGATTANDHLGIVIKTKPTYNEEAVDARGTVKAAYDQAIADLTAAVSKLPDTRDGIRADRYTALAFLARIYLQQGDYAKARDAANEVIESGNYSMNGDIMEAFTKDLTDEVIWEIEQDVQNNAGTSNDGMATFYASLPGIGRADVRIEQAFIDTYLPGDLRKTEWYYTGIGARPGNPYSAKWTAFEQNLPIIRLAEMYLIRAECNLRLGTAVGDTPANDLAQVRNPARVGLPVILAPTLADILQERIWELAFEGVRIHDIKRLRLSTGTFAWNHDMLVFPIPQREVDASRGVIVQNPGY